MAEQQQPKRHEEVHDFKIPTSAAALPNNCYLFDISQMRIAE